MAVEEPPPELATLADLPFHVAGRHPKPLLIGQCRNGTIAGESTRDWFDRIRDLALGLTSIGIEPGDRVVIMSDSRPEWLLADFAILTLGAVTVPIYSTLMPSQVRYMVADSGARVAFVSNIEQLEKLQRVRHELPGLEVVVVFDPADQRPTSVVTLDALVERGHVRLMSEWGVARQFRDRARAVRPGQLATIIYTSGTTGEPKGVMLSHDNLISNLLAGRSVIGVNEDDVSLSFLPLSHSFERLVSYINLAQGVTVIFAESMETIARDMAVVRPTVMTGVPRVYEKFQARILERGGALPQPRRSLFDWGLKVARARGRTEAMGGRVKGLLALAVALADRLVFSKIRDSVGGRLRCLVSGSAPLPIAVAEFFHGIGLPITEGYGLTETSPILTANPLGAARLGTVGKPIPGVEVRIAADGEILARGPNVMMGYYNKPEETAAVLRDGWFHTGDVGTLDADGYLTITDRKKDLLVTSGGKKIAPQPIEAVLTRSPLVAEAIVLGDRRRFASALIVPNFPALERRLKDLGRPPAPREELVRREDVTALYQEIVDALNRDLSQYERIKKIRLLPREFSIESGELTPTMKVKRRVVEQNWADAIEELYKELPA
ncbi:MAG TPA: long-chain fatty acid--CoA ligase [Vicinamibacterales bacterium]|nr:long-chain fatty acid--CoA ligase [Vicinamibacterales bacterium]